MNTGQKFVHCDGILLSGYVVNVREESAWVASRFALLTKSKSMRWVGHVALVGTKRNAWRVVVGKPEGMIKWQVLNIDGKIILNLILWNVMGRCELGPFGWGSHGTICYHFALWPANAQLFHKLSHCYIFRHYRFHPQGACNQYLANLHKNFKCSCW